VIGDLRELTGLGAEMARRARAAGVLLVWRTQARAMARVVVRKGRAEDTGISSLSGHGVQVYTSDHRTALASRDDFDGEKALRLLDRVVAAAHSGEALGLEPARAADLTPASGEAVPATAATFESIDLAAVTKRLAELEAEIAGAVPGVALQLSYTADLDAWRIFRSDGTDVLFAMPRAAVRVSATSGGSGPRHTLGASLSRPDSRLLWDDAAVACFLKRARNAARLARALPDAEPHPAGSFPLVIDYALAKGLAHEAFGHSSEADGFRSSVLAKEGRFRTGEIVGAPHVSIVDEPVAGDHAWQPFASNGEPRRRATIVDRGRLKDALSDPWTAERAGVPLTGAERAESYRNAPLPRMTNIRIEVESPLGAKGSFEDYGPEEVRDLLDSAGVLRRHPRVAFLSGYSGGQANPATGDFVFNCKAIYGLARDRITLHKAAIFSGSMFGALRAVREGFGPLLLDAIGTCGKWGQSVPSSGGSHWFLVLDPDPTVRLGGADE
jgi:TldD protein